MTKTDVDRFVLLPEHIKLLQSMYVDWDDSAYDGAPAIDLKRPYGNSGGVEGDIVEILDLPTIESHGETVIEDDVIERARELHRQTAQALQVIIRCASVEPGVYEAPRYSQKWERVGDVPKPPVCNYDGDERFTCTLPLDHKPIENGIEGHDGYWQPVPGGGLYYTSDAARERGHDV